MAAIDVLMANLVDDGVGMRAMMFVFEKMPVHRRRVGGMNMGTTWVNRFVLTKCCVG
jgi:hypothetical protein